MFFLLFFNIYNKVIEENFIISLQSFYDNLSYSKLHFLILGIIFTFLNWSFESLKYYLTIQKVQKINFLKSFKGILIGNAFNLILPMSIGELTGRPLVLKEKNRAKGSGVAYYVSIVQKVASPLIGLIFLWYATLNNLIDSSNFKFWGFNFKTILPIISFLDLLFWAFLFIYPTYILLLFKRIDFFKNIMEEVEKVLHYDLILKIKLILIGMIRFIIFVLQYWFITFLFFNNFPMFDFFILIGVYFLAQFVIPSFGFLDIAIRANIVSIIFANYTTNFIQLIAVNYVIWIINLLLPSILGFYFIRRKIV